jgi:hypothetical protein
MKRFMALALGASALAVAACVPQGQGPGYGHNSVAYNPSYDDDHRRPPLRIGNDDTYGRTDHDGRWDGNGPPPPWANGNGNDGRDNDGRGHDGPPPWSMAHSGNGMGDDHHDGAPPPWAGNGSGNGPGGNNGGWNGQGQPHGTQPSGPPDQHGYCGPVVFPGCMPRH